MTIGHQHTFLCDLMLPVWRTSVEVNLWEHVIEKLHCVSLDTSKNNSWSESFPVDLRSQTYVADLQLETFLADLLPQTFLADLRVRLFLAYLL